MTKILVHCPIKGDATSFYRGLGPLNHLKRTNPKIEIIDLSIHNDQEIGWEVLTQGDILFLQRPSAMYYTRLIKMAKACGIPVWIDYDDDYFNIPTTNPRHGLYSNPHRVESIRRCILEADHITVSTIHIKEAIAKATGKDRSAMTIIPNAIDETIFNTEIPFDLGARDIVLWRGGDTHEADLLPYIQKMTQLYDEFQKYRWAFLGNAPKEFLKYIDSKRIILYNWADLFGYFDHLFELQPRVTIVPWEDNLFNASKSNISWLESTLAGGATVFPKFSTEYVDTMLGYNSPEEFYNQTKLAMLDNDTYLASVAESFIKIENSYTLRAINPMRESIIADLIATKKKIGIPSVKKEGIRYTDEEFFNYTHEMALNQDHESYKHHHFKLADDLIDRFKPKSVVEIGCGPGAILERMLDQRIPQAKGFEINKFFKDYFVKRNPHYADHFFTEDFDEAVLDGVFDLAISIEVFEHIEADKCDAIIERMSKHFRYFYFSSTPYRENAKFDKEWGHINIRTHEMWIKTFEARGWKYVENPNMITLWDHVFESTNVK